MRYTFETEDESEFRVLSRATDLYIACIKMADQFRSQHKYEDKDLWSEDDVRALLSKVLEITYDIGG